MAWLESSNTTSGAVTVCSPVAMVTVSPSAAVSLMVPSRASQLSSSHTASLAVLVSVSRMSTCPLATMLRMRWSSGSKLTSSCRQVNEFPSCITVVSPRKAAACAETSYIIESSQVMRTEALRFIRKGRPCHSSPSSGGPESSSSAPVHSRAPAPATWNRLFSR